MNIKSIISTLLTCALALTTAESMAQKKEGELEDAEFVIQKNRKIELPEAPRLMEKLKIPMNTEEPKPLQYQYSEFKPGLPKLESQVQVLNMKDEPAKSYPQGYVKAGIGNYTTRIFDAYYNLKKGKNETSFLVNHNGSVGGPVDNLPSGFSNTLLGVGNRLETKSLVFTGGINYERNRVNYFAYNPDRLKNQDTIKQLFNRVGGTLAIRNLKDTTNLNYSLRADFSRLSNLQSQSENLVDISGSLAYQLKKGQKIGLDASSFIAQFTDSLTISRTLLKFKPFYQYQTNDLQVRVGINTVYENDTLEGNGGIHTYPDLRAAYYLSKNQWFALHINGDMQGRNFHTSVQENPWLSASPVLANTNNTLSAGLSFNGHKDALAYRASVNYDAYKNQAFWLNTRSDTARFNLYYSALTTSRFRAEAGLSYTLLNKANFWMNAAFNSYSLNDSIKVAAHLPVIEVSGGASYQIDDKWAFSGVFNLWQGRKTLLRNTDSGLGNVIEKDLGLLFDLSLQVDYRINKKFTAFILAENLLNQTNNRYLYYPSRGVTGLAGIKVNF